MASINNYKKGRIVKPTDNLPQVILKAEVLEMMDSGEPFDLVFCTADRHKGTGGEVIEVKQWVKVSGEQLRMSGSKVIRKKADKLKRDPDHIKNKTINIRDLRNPNKVRKVHIRLIGFFNNQRVVQ
jgi:hypothetical protein